MTLVYRYNSTLGRVIKSYWYVAKFVKQILKLGTHQNYLGNFFLTHLPGLFTSDLLNLVLYGRGPDVQF